jgi:hypothetical protein
MWPFNNEKKEFIHRISQPSVLTPDLPMILSKPKQLVFACDDLMYAHQGHDLIKDASMRVGRGFTRNKFDFRVCAQSGMGIPLTGNRHSNPLKIKGEIHAVRSEVIKTLDFVYANGIAYHRTKANVLVPERLLRVFSIGEEETVMHLPPGSIRTFSETGTRRYVSNRMVGIVQAWMYVASKEYWTEIDGGYNYPKADIHEPKDYIPWLPQYYKYPIDLNRNK